MYAGATRIQHPTKSMLLAVSIIYVCFEIRSTQFADELRMLDSLRGLNLKRRISNATKVSVTRTFYYDLNLEEIL